jgi:hypothetical protein
MFHSDMLFLQKKFVEMEVSALFQQVEMYAFLTAPHDYYIPYYGTNIQATACCISE